MSEERGEMELVMPFVVVTSKGGPFDDGAFVAGYRLGHIDAVLAACAAINGGATPPASYVDTRELPQVDLIAMKHGFKVTATEWDDDPTWTLVEFALSDEESR